MVAGGEFEGEGQGERGTISNLLCLLSGHFARSVCVAKRAGPEFKGDKASFSLQISIDTPGRQPRASRARLQAWAGQLQARRPAESSQCEILFTWSEPNSCLQVMMQMAARTGDLCRLASRRPLAADLPPASSRLDSNQTNAASWLQWASPEFGLAGAAGLHNIGPGWRRTGATRWTTTRRVQLNGPLGATFSQSETRPNVGPFSPKLAINLALAAASATATAPTTATAPVTGQPGGAGPLSLITRGRQAWRTADQPTRTESRFLLAGSSRPQVAPAPVPVPVAAAALSGRRSGSQHSGRQPEERGWQRRGEQLEAPAARCQPQA